MRRACAAVVIAVVVLAAGIAARAGSVSLSSGRTALDADFSLSPAAARTVLVGRSVQGRPIRAYELGDQHAARRALVVGCLHGDETAGEAITRRLRTLPPQPNVDLWLVNEFNPDGCRAHTRQNARGVDLNRNSPWRWRPSQPGTTYYSGPGPLSEPESRAIHRLVLQLRPAVSIWYHQHAALVDDSGGSRSVERRYARLVGLPFVHYGLRPGSITSWEDATLRGATAFVVELPPGPLPPSSVARHAAAVLALAHG